MRQVLTYALAGLMVFTVLTVPVAIVAAILYVTVFKDPVILKLLGAMAVIFVIGVAWTAATGNGEKKEAADS